MWLIDQLADRHITAAINNGELDNLPGAGKPLELDADSMMPDDRRAGYRLLNYAGFLPTELRLRNEIATLEQLPGDVVSREQDEKRNRRMQALRLRLNTVRCESSVWQETYYAHKRYQASAKVE